MAAGYAEMANQGLASLQVSEGLLRHLLQAEAEDRHIRSIRYLCPMGINCNLQDFRCIVTLPVLILTPPTSTVR